MIVRANKDSFAYIYNEADQIADGLNACIQLVTNFMADAPNLIPNVYDEKTYEGVDSEGKPRTYTKKVERWKEAKEDFKKLCNASKGRGCGSLGMAESKVRKVADSLKEIERLLVAFEEDSEQSVSLQEMVNSSSSSSSSSPLSVELVDGVEVLYYDLDGKKLTIAEFTNTFYTYSGVAMDSQIQGYLENDSFATNTELQKQALEDVQAFIGTAQTARAFGVASMDSIQNVADTLGVRTLLAEATSVLVSKVDNEIQSYVTSQASVAGFALIGAYALTEGLFKKEEEPEKTTFVGGNSQQAIFNVSSLPNNQNTEFTYQEAVNNQEQVRPSIPPLQETLPEIVSTTNEEMPEIVSVTSEEIPETIPSLEENDYDLLALEEFETLDIESVTERTTKVVEEALQLYEAEDKTLLREKLTEFGYSDPEIEAILENQDYVLTAFIEGDRREQLSEIAIQLADLDGIKDFDTSYDDGQHYDDLINGTSSDFITAMGSDPTVTETRTAYFEARENHEALLEEANLSIETAKTAKANLENLQKEIGSDESRWSATQVEEYNTSVKQYNDAVKESQEKVVAYQEAKESYIKCKEDYYKAKEDYLKKVKEDRIDTLEENHTELNKGEQVSFEKDKGITSEVLRPEETVKNEPDVLSLDNEELLQNIRVNNQNSIEFLE